MIFKKPLFWVAVLAVICITVTAISLISDSDNSNSDGNTGSEITENNENTDNIYYTPDGKTLGGYFYKSVELCYHSYAESSFAPKDDLKFALGHDTSMLMTGYSVKDKEEMQCLGRFVRFEGLDKLIGGDTLLCKSYWMADIITKLRRSDTEVFMCSPYSIHGVVYTYIAVCSDGDMYLLYHNRRESFSRVYKIQRTEVLAKTDKSYPMLFDVGTYNNVEDESVYGDIQISGSSSGEFIITVDASIKSGDDFQLYSEQIVCDRGIAYFEDIIYGDPPVIAVKCDNGKLLRYLVKFENERLVVTLIDQE